MPNWSYGRLKIRGKYQSVVQCLKDMCYPMKTVYEDGNYVFVPNPDAVSIKESDDARWTDIFIMMDKCYIKDSQRAFFAAQDVSVYAPDEPRPTTISLEFQQAWAAKADNFTSYSKKWNVDIRIQTFEGWAGFAQDIIIESGIIKKDTYTEYKDWVWECPVPDFGGYGGIANA